MKKQAVIILGAPGAGKGTQANLLADRFGFEHVETSKIGEDFLKRCKKEYVVEEGKRFSLETQKKLFLEGELWDPLFVVHIMKDEIKRLIEAGESVILTGSPRTVPEAQRVMPFLKKEFGEKNIKIFFLDISVDDSIYRNSHRRICSLMRHPILWHEETKNLTICPLDGSKLRKRKIDKEEIIEERCRVFERRTKPMLAWLEENGYEVAHVDGRPSVAEVFNSILSHFNG